MKVNVLVAEIGSTTTIINAFDDLGSKPKFLGQGQSYTTVLEGDVTLGLNRAIEDLKVNLDTPHLEWDNFLATSSAAGGLKISVHGLVYDMTVKATKEAVLGAGGNLSFVTAGKLRDSQLEKIRELKPNIIIIAGGVDYGEFETSLHNSRLIANLNLKIPVIYCGNIEIQNEIREIFKNYSSKLYITENVYPNIDSLNVEPVRKVIQEVFEEHIIIAPGMEKIKSLVDGTIMTTPGAVMEASKILKEEIGNLITFDLGGATTDVHSITTDKKENENLRLSPEPIAKRTVEGDLGLYLNLDNLTKTLSLESISITLGISVEELEELISKLKQIPSSENEIKLIEILSIEALQLALSRHSGYYKKSFGTTKKSFIIGKDLSNIKWIIGTGGALTKLSSGKMVLERVKLKNYGNKLVPSKEARILIDSKYIMASLGALSRLNKEASLYLMKGSLCIQNLK